MKLFLSLQLVVLALLAPSSCTSDWDLPRCSSQGCYGYDESWELTMATKAGGIQYIAINGAWSVDPIIVSKGDRIRIKVINKLSEDVTLHFHGILQKNMYTLLDGPQGITQSGIFPGASFTYDFEASEAGSYWIHSHAPGQYPKGLRAALIVRDQADPTIYGYELAYDQVITVSDWWQNFTEVEENYLPKKLQFPFPPGIELGSKCGPGIEPYPLRAIMNDHVPEINNRPKEPGSVSIAIDSGKTARLRFINISAYARFYIYIPDHKMRVIELDGVSMEIGPETEGIEVSSGQRVSVLVTGNQDPTKRYGIVAAIDPRLNPGRMTDWNRNSPECTWSLPPPFDGDRANVEYVVGALTYVDSLGVVFDKTSEWLTRKPWEDKSLMSYRLNVPWVVVSQRTKDGITTQVPHYPWAFDETALTPISPTGKWDDVQDGNIHLLELIDTPATQFGGHQIGGQWGSINRNLFTSPETGNTLGQLPADQGAPALLRVIQKNNDDCNNPDVYVSSKQTVVMQDNEVHWFVIRGNLGDHPIHMHGHSFQILGHRLEDVTDEVWADSSQNVKMIREKVSASAKAFPAMRDTLMVEKYTISVVAVKADNPGVWALHCHNDFHSATGMMMQLVESPNIIRDTIGTFEAIQNSTGNYLIASDPPNGKAPKSRFDDQARQAWHNGMNLWWNYWVFR